MIEDLIGEKTPCGSVAQLAHSSAWDQFYALVATAILRFPEHNAPD